jgi:hypothetical protein
MKGGREAKPSQVTLSTIEKHVSAREKNRVAVGYETKPKDNECSSWASSNGPPGAIQLYLA